MRMTKEALLKRQPWNENVNDIVEVSYGDTPLIRWDEERYQWFKKLTSTVSNIMAADAYIYVNNGAYDIYRTLIGDIRIGENGNILCGDLTFKNGGKSYTIYLNLMYGMKGLRIIRYSCTAGNVGFINKDGGIASSLGVKELDAEIIEKVLSDPLSDYGVAVQKIMDAARKVYSDDPTNYILERPFTA